VSTPGAPFVRLALLADFAQAQPDGRFQIVGGGIRSLSFETFPARIDRLSLALALEFTAAQVPGLSQDAWLVINSTNPSGEPFVPVARTVLRPRSLNPEGDISSVELVVNWLNIVFGQPGPHLFTVSFQDQTLTNVPLLVQTGTVSGVTNERPWEAGIYEGVKAFSSGQVDEARRQFEVVTKEFPAVAEGWNNLGFVQLDGGAAKQAEVSFRRAAELGFARTAMLAVNLGGAQYVEGRYQESVARFADALGATKFDGPGVLHAITKAGLHTVPIQDVKDFIGLALLNTGWAEARLRNFPGARSAAAAARELAAGPDGAVPRWLQDSCDQLDELVGESNSPGSDPTQ